MTNLSENILDLDQLKDEPLEIPEVAVNKAETPVIKERKKPGRKKGSSQRLKGLANPLLMGSDGPKLSREERKNLQLQELFDKMEQKEKKKEDNIRKKRKLNSERSPNLSITQAESNQDDEGDGQQEENGSPKSDMRSPMRERTPVSKKSEPVQVNSKYLNTEFDLGGSRNLITYLYEYQKENAKKYNISWQNQIDIGTNLFNNNKQTPEGSLVFKVEPEKLNQLNTQLKQQNEKLVEHLKNYEQVQATKDLRHAFYNYDYK